MRCTEIQIQPLAYTVEDGRSTASAFLPENAEDHVSGHLRSARDAADCGLCTRRQQVGRHLRRSPQTTCSDLTCGNSTTPPNVLAEPRIWPQSATDTARG